MTIVIGIKCNDGIVLACDSQSSFGRGVEVKRLNSNKIYKLDGKTALAGAGTIAQIRTVVETIKYGLEEQRRQLGVELEEEDCRDIIEKGLLSLHKRYNIDRSRYLNIPIDGNDSYFDSIALFCHRHGDGPSAILSLYILHSDGMVEPIDDYATVGSGAAYAELLLKNLYRNDMTVEEGKGIAMFSINEVEEMDPSCGGPIKVSILQNGGELMELSNDDIMDYLKKVQPTLAHINKVVVAKVLRGEISDGNVRDFTKER